MTHSVHTKVTWEQKVSSSWEEVFYTSLVKKIRKSDSYFENLFELRISKIDNIEESDDFFKLYDKEIASRGNYLYKQNEQREVLNKKLLDGKNYLQGSLIKKDTNEYAGGIIFSIIENRFAFSLRAFDRKIRSTYRAQTSLDFWVEKKMYEYASTQNISMMTHGTDNYPNKGRIGLVLFKLKVGGKPKVSKKEHDILELTEDDIRAFNSPTLFWDLPDENGKFKRAQLFYKEGEIDENVLSELIKVTSWSGIELNTTVL